MCKNNAMKREVATWTSKWGIFVEYVRLIGRKLSSHIAVCFLKKDIRNFIRQIPRWTDLTLADADAGHDPIFTEKARNTRQCVKDGRLKIPTRNRYERVGKQIK